MRSPSSADASREGRPPRRGFFIDLLSGSATRQGKTLPNEHSRATGDPRGASHGGPSQLHVRYRSSRRSERFVVVRIGAFYNATLITNAPLAQATSRSQCRSRLLAHPSPDRRHQERSAARGKPDLSETCLIVSG